MQLGEPEDQRQRRHEDDAAADAEQAGEHAADHADQRDEDQGRHTSSRTPTAASSNANP